MVKSLSPDLPRVHGSDVDADSLETFDDRFFGSVEDHPWRKLILKSSSMFSDRKT